MDNDNTSAISATNEGQKVKLLANPQPLKITTKKSQISFVFDKKGGSEVLRCLATENGTEIPEHRFQRDKPAVDMAEIGEAEAQEILSFYNIANRQASPRYIKSYAAEFLAGDWKFNGEAIKFADSDSKDVPYRLLDGQNRLAGYVLACDTARQEGTTLPSYKTVVIMGLEDEAQKKMDRNFKRSMKSMFHFSDIAAVNNTAFSMARKVAVLANLTEVHGIVSDRDLQRTYDEYGQSINAVALQMANGVGGVKKVAINSAIVFYHKVNTKKAEEFLSQLVDGENLTKGSPALMLRNFFLNSRGVKRRDWKEEFGKCVAAMSAHNQGTLLHKLQGRKWTNDLNWVKECKPLIKVPRDSDIKIPTTTTTTTEVSSFGV